MKKGKQIGLSILLVLAALTVAALLARNVILRRVTERAIEQATGFEVEVAHFQYGLAGSTIEVRGVRLLNPAGYAEPVALEIERLLVQYNLKSLFSRDVRLPQIQLIIPRIVLVQLPTGETNFGRLAEETRIRSARPQPTLEPPPAPPPQPETPADEAPPPAPAPPAPPAPREAPPPRTLLIERLTVAIGTAEYHRYRADQAEPEIHIEQVNWERTYENVRDLEDVSQQIAGELVARQVSQEIGRLAEQHGVELRLDQEQVDRASRALRRFLDKRQPAAE